MVNNERQRIRFGAAAGGLFGLIAVVHSASAAEQIVLPFECQSVGGRVVARPAPDQAYRIHGDREQRRFTACSRRDPDRCRTFQIHRFTLSCGRSRVSWPQFYAAISKATDGAAQMEDGQIIYRFGQGGPRSETYGFDDPYPDRQGGRALVAMPRGFAPLTGSDAIFTPLDPRIAALEDKPLEAPQEAEQLPAAGAPAPPAVAPSEPKPGVKPPAAAAAAPAAGEGPPPQSTVKAEPPPPAGPSSEPQPETADAAAVSAPQSSAPGSSSAPKSGSVSGDGSGGTAEGPPPVTILNSPAAQKLREAARSPDSGPSTVVAAQELTPPPKPETAPPGSGAVQGWSSQGQGFGISLPPLVFAFGIAIATLIALFMILRRQAEMAQPSTGTLPWTADQPVLPGLGPEGGPEPGAAPAPEPGKSLAVRLAALEPALSASAPDSAGMPATRTEALETLGLSADAGEAAIRKVVEGLRQSWHPDLASGETDRQAREERLKRINVAADILLRQPAA